MNIMSGLVFSRQFLEAQQRILGTEQRRLDEKWRRRCVWLAGLTVVLGMTVVMQAGSLRLVLPLKQILPLILWRHESGVIEAAVTPEALQVDMRDSTLQATVFQYTMWRESYNAQTIGFAHSVVDAMSSTKVAEEYNDWIGASTNSKSYQIVYGDKCTVFVVEDVTDPKIEWVPPGPQGSRPGRYTFHFWRYVTCRGEPQQPSTEWTASVNFLAGYQGDLNFPITKMFNAPRIVVIGYMPPQPVSATPKDMTR